MKFRIAVAVVFACVFSVKAVWAQSGTGFQPGSSFSGGGSVDSTNMNTVMPHLTFPLGSVNGRIPVAAAITFDGYGQWQVWSNQYGYGVNPAPGNGWPSPLLTIFGYVTYNDVSFDCVAGGVEYSWDEYNLLAYNDKANTAHPVSVWVSDASLQGVPSSCNTHHYPTTASGTSTDGAGYTVNAFFRTNGTLAWSVASADGDYILPPDETGALSETWPYVFSWTDRNGNQINATVTGAGAGSTATWTTTITGSLGTALLSETHYVNQGPPSQLVYNYPTPGGGSNTITVNYQNFTILPPNWTGSGWSASLVTSIEYGVDNSRYTIAYETSPGNSADVTGRVASVGLPLGGIIQYQYSGTDYGITPWPNSSSATLTRTVSGGIDTSGAWTYAQTQSTSSGTTSTTTTVTDPAGNHLVVSFTNGVETSRSAYQGAVSSQNLISTVGTSTTGKPIIQRTVTISLGNLVRKTVSNYDVGHGMLTETDDYDWGTGAAGSLLRKVTYSYATIAGPLATIYDRPTDVRTYGPDGTTIVAETTYAYDGASLASTAGVAVQHDYTNFPATATARGNATSVSQCTGIGFPVGWTAGNCPSSSTTANQYNDLGELVLITDALGVKACFDFTDNYSDNNNHNTFAFMTRKASLVSSCGPGQGGTFVESFQYDWQTGLLAKSTDWNGQSTTHHYDGLMRKTETDFADGGKTVVNYPPNSNANEIWTWKYADSTNHTESRQHLDGFGRPDRTAFSNAQGSFDQADTCYDATGRVSFASYSYQSSGFSMAKVCSNSGTLKGDAFAYDAVGRQITVTHSDNTTLSTSYSGNAVKVQDEGNGSGTLVTHVYQSDGLGRNIYACEEASSIWGSTASPCGLNIDGTQNGFITSNSYDALGNLLSITQGSLEQRKFIYNGASQLVGEFIPEANSANCQPTGITGATFYTECYFYDAAGKLTSRKRPKANQTGSLLTTTTYQYNDSLPHLTSVTYDDGITPAVTFSYGSAQTTILWGQALDNTLGRITTAFVGTSPGTAASLFSYDPVGRTKTNGQCTPYNCTGSNSPWYLNYNYDLAGNVTSATNGNSVTFTPTYNSAQRITQLASSSSLGPSTLISGLQYNALGAATGDTLGNQVGETFGYDVRGRLTSVAASKAGLTNGTGSLTINGSEGGNVTQSATSGTGWVSLDGADQSVVTCDDSGRNCHTIYDRGTISITVEGFQASTTYGKISTSSGLASTLAAQLNGVGSPVTASVSGSTINLTSSAAGSASNYSLSISSSSNDSNDFGSGSFDLTPSGSNLTGGTDAITTYDAGSVSVTVNGTPSSASYAQGSTNSSVASALASAVNANSPWVNASASGNVVTLTSKTGGSGTNYSLSASSSSSNGFNPVSFTASTSSSALTGGTGGAVYSVGLGFTPNGNVGSSNDTANGNWTYNYDALNRLSSTSGQAAITFGTDRNGIRGLQSGGWNQSIDQTTNRVAAVAYDAAGNMTSDTFHNYTYDAEGRILQVDGGITASYLYDAFGARVRKTVSATSTDFIYDLGSNKIVELADGTMQRSEIYLGGRHLATYTNGTTYFAHQDWLGTDRVRSGMNGNLYQSWTNYPYGDNQTCTTSCPGTDISTVHFAGMEYDPETQLYHTPNRYYNPRIGGWITPDPAGQSAADPSNPQSNNRYAYAMNNPATHTDPSGLFTQDGDLFGPPPLGIGPDPLDFWRDWGAPGPPWDVTRGFGGSIITMLAPQAGTNTGTAFLPGDEVWLMPNSPFDFLPGWARCGIGIAMGGGASCASADSGCEFGACGPGPTGSFQQGQSENPSQTKVCDSRGNCESIPTPTFEISVSASLCDGPCLPSGAATVFRSVAVQTRPLVQFSNCATAAGATAVPGMSNVIGSNNAYPGLTNLGPIAGLTKWIFGKTKLLPVLGPYIQKAPVGRIFAAATVVNAGATMYQCLKNPAGAASQ